MNPALWGTVTALSWGSADFIARFTGRALGVEIALFGMLAVGSVTMSLWVWLAGAPLVWRGDGLGWVVGAGVAITVGTLLLYSALVRGPVAVAAPISASYPVLIVAGEFALGTRPSALQWAAIAATMLGVWIVARGGGAALDSAAARGLAPTVLRALGSAVAFAAALFCAREAVAVYGEIETVWLARLVSLACVMAILVVRRGRPRLPARWWPPVAAQGLLDTFAYVALFTGAAGEGAVLAAVASSAFGVVTVILARIVLREAIGAAQWGGIALVSGGVAVLAASA